MTSVHCSNSTLQRKIKWQCFFRMLTKTWLHCLSSTFFLGNYFQHTTNHSKAQQTRTDAHWTNTKLISTSFGNLTSTACNRTNTKQQPQMQTQHHVHVQRRLHNLQVFGHTGAHLRWLGAKAGRVHPHSKQCRLRQCGVHALPRQWLPCT